MKKCALQDQLVRTMFAKRHISGSQRLEATNQHGMHQARRARKPQSTGEWPHLNEFECDLESITEAISGL